MTEEDAPRGTAGHLEREEYFEHRKILNEIEGEQSQSFDKTMISLAGGALALSLTLIHLVAPSPHDTIWLFVAWLCFAGAMLSTLVSFLTSQRSVSVERFRLDRDERSGYIADPERNWWTRLTKLLNLLAVISFMCGIGFFAWFAYVNLPAK